MKYCTKCNLSVNTNLERCPLCSSILSDSEVKKAVRNTGGSSAYETYKPSVGYPKREVSTPQKYNFMFRLLLFLSIAVGTTCLLVNILTYSGVLWSLVVAGSILCLWIVIAYPLYMRRKIGHMIIVDAISFSILLYIIEVTTHSKGWGLEYVIPFIFIAATSMITFIIFLKKMKWREYSVYQIVMIILGLLPVIVCISGMVTTVWPSIVSAFYSFLTFTGMLIFADKKYENELIKRFHF